LNFLKYTHFLPVHSHSEADLSLSRSLGLNMSLHEPRKEFFQFIWFRLGFFHSFSLPFFGKILWVQRAAHFNAARAGRKRTFFALPFYFFRFPLRGFRL